IGGKDGMIIAFIFAVILNFSAYWFSKDMVLRMYNAQEINPQTSPEIYHMIQELAIRAHLPTPEIYIINEVQPNAFATGRDPNNAAIAFTIGILNLLDYEELQAVAAHEMSHIRNRDTLISTVAAIVAGSIAALANFALIFGSRDENGRSNIIFGILIAILAPIAASIMQLAISRSREYMADEGAAWLTNNPQALARALIKIENHAHNVYMKPAQENPATAQMMIINPLSGNSDNLFSTHPNIQNRIERLKEIAKHMGQI
ncbi:MAG TPA: M48 family metalloprotease, partial [Burkholderiales bacterium]|nr:M48 family metalloprotease [Burkholderiales bacterium]